MKILYNEHRTTEQVREHYEIEKELAIRLRNASKQERRHLYSSLYNEMYLRVPHHPQLTQKSSHQKTLAAVSAQIKLFKHLLGKEITFLEVGPGDCALSLEVTKHVKQVCAVDAIVLLTYPYLSDTLSHRLSQETIQPLYSSLLRSTDTPALQNAS